MLPITADRDPAQRHWANELFNILTLAAYFAAQSYPQHEKAIDTLNAIRFRQKRRERKKAEEAAAAAAGGVGGSNTAGGGGGKAGEGSASGGGRRVSGSMDVDSSGDDGLGGKKDPSHKEPTMEEDRALALSVLRLFHDDSLANKEIDRQLAKRPSRSGELITDSVARDISKNFQWFVIQNWERREQLTISKDQSALTNIAREFKKVRR